ncbi:MAG: hypothetical protein QM784_02120 [Polyangiaceae bacterium]
MKLVATTYSATNSEEDKDYDIILNFLGRVVPRLSECLNGRTLLGKWQRSNPYWLATYVQPQTQLSDPQFQVARKSFAAVLAILEEMAKAEIALRPRELEPIFTTLETHITRVFRDKLFEKKGHVETYRYVSSKLNVATPVTVVHAAAIAQLDLDVKIARLIENTTQLSSVVSQGIARFLEVINLASSASAVLTDGSFDDYVNLIGSGLDASSAFASLLGLGSRPIGVIGALSSVIDTYLAGGAGAAAYASNDYSSVAGNFAVGLGSTMACLGAVESLGPSTAATFGGLSVGVWGAIAVGIGWATIAVFGDSDLQVFVGHCCFGVDYGEGTATPKWSPTALGAWRGTKVGNVWDRKTENFTAQLESLLSLLAAFSLEYRSSECVRVTPSYLRPESNFVIFADAVGTGLAGQTVHCRFEVTVNVATKTMLDVGSGHPINQRAISFFEDQDGAATAFELTFVPKPGSTPEYSFLQSHATCWVRLDLHGDGRVLIPPVAPFSVRLDLQLASRDPVSSKDG